MQSAPQPGYLLSPQQQLLWRLQSGGRESAYLAQGEVHLLGPLDRQVLRRSWQQLLARHEILRTSFRRLDGMALPLQRVEPAGRCTEIEHELSAAPPATRQRRLAELRAALAQTPFDLAQGRVVRAALVRLAPLHHLLLIALPALCCDARALVNLVAELGDSYAAILAGRAEAGRPLQYADFAQWQSELAATAGEPRQAAFWLASAPPRLLSLRLVEEDAGDGDGGAPFVPRTVVQELGTGTARAVTALAAAAAVSPAAFYLTCWQLLLARLADQPEVVIGIAVAGRDYEELQGAVGLFARVIPVALTVRPERPFAEALIRTQQRLDEARLHQESFSWDLPALAEAGCGGEPPFFPYAFEDEEPPAPERGAAGLLWRLAAARACTTRCKLKLAVSPGPAGAALALHFDAQRFSAAAARRLLERLATLVASALAAPAVAAGDVAVVGGAERHRLWVELNDTALALAGERRLEEHVAAQVERTPGQIAACCAGRQISYRALDRRAARLAGRLRARGVGAESLVAIRMERSLELLVAVLAVLKAGGAYLPIEPDAPPERLRLMLADARPGLVLVDGRATPPPAADCGVLAVEPLAAAAGEDGEGAEEPEEPADAAPGATERRLERWRGGAGNLAYVLFTSGSSGRPKAVAVGHRAIVNRLLWMQSAYPIDARDRVLLKTPLSFDASIWELFLPLMTGARLIVARQDEQRDAASLVRTVAEQRVTILQLVPSLLGVVLDEAAIDSCTSLRRIFCGGEALPATLAELCSRRLGAELCNLYGPTEAAIDATCWRYDGRGDAATVPIGRPLANVRVYLLDGRLGPVPAGTPGELYIGGAGLARGYLGQPERTAESFLPDPTGGNGDRLYRTGDLARHLPQGALEFLGRRDHQIKLRGQRVELGEIEHALRTQPQVRDAVVLLHGEAGAPRYLVAYLTHSASGGAPAAAELTARLRQRLPEHMVPAVFVPLPALPLLPNGKVDRRALPAPAPAGARRRTPPRNTVEELLAGIWSDLLRVGEVGIEDNFFELGGDSILAIQVVARARKAGFTVHPRQLFEHQTLAGLASALLRPADAAAPARQPTLVGPLPLTAIQCYFFEQLLPDPGHYNQSVLLTLRRPLHPPRLAAALGRLAARHEALRLRFVRQPDGWQQLLPPALAPAPAPVPVSELDLRRLAGPALAAALAAAKAAAQGSLDLGRGPLFRAVRLTLPAASQLLLVAHHLVVDAVSWRLLLEELAALCEGPAGHEPPEPPPPISFGAWALAASRLARSPALAGESAFWLAAAPPAAPLPVDLAGANTVASARRCTVALDAEETAGLLREVPAAYHTRIDETLLTALAQAVAAWTGGPALLVDVEAHGREEIEPGLDLSRTVGWLTAVYPATIELPGAAAGPGESLQAVKERLRAVPGRGAGYGLLRYLGGDLEVAAALARRPPAQISWNYLGQLDLSVPAAAPFAPAAESPGPAQSPRQPRRYLVEVVAAVVEGRLRLTFTYSAAVHRAETIERLAAAMRQRLGLLVAHCRSPLAGGFTPADFPLAALDQQTLDGLAAGLGGPIEDLYPLSPVQQGLLFHALDDPGSEAYFQQLSCPLRGALDAAALAAAWQAAGALHPVLRTAFVRHGAAGETLDRPLQIVHRACGPPPAILDWRHRPATAHAAALAAFEAEDRRRGFDPARPPLSRLTLIRLGDELWQLVWSHHHLILDGWSVPLLIGDVFAAYEALRHGRQPSLVHRPPYRDFIAWLARQGRAAVESRWRRALAGFTAPTPLPADRPQALRQPAAEHRLTTATLAAAATSGLRQCARRERLTLNTLLQGAWALLLARYAGVRDVLFGGVTAGRPAELPEVEAMLGTFINTLPVRVEIAARQPVAAWLRGLQEQQAELRRFDHAALVDLHAWSDVTAGAPLFDSLLVFENFPVDERLRGLGAGLDLEIGPARWRERTHYPLVLAAAPAAALPLQIDATAAFDPATARRLLASLESLLAGIAAAPHGAVEEIPLLRAAERHQVLAEWSDSAAALGPDRCLHELFEAQARMRPTAVAVRADGAVLSYGGLDRRANQLAHRLRRLGVGPDSIVALCLDRSPELVVAILATWKAGGAYLPLDPGHPAERLERLCAAARPAALLIRSDLAWRPAAAGPELLALDLEAAAIAGASGSAPRCRANPDNLAYVIYTSGSTGQPKGVMVSHRAIANRVLWTLREYPLTVSDRLLQKTPAVFDASIWEVCAPLLAGAELILADPGGHRDAAYLGRAVCELGVTVLQLVPSMLRAFVELPELERCGSLTRLFSGGEALPAALAESVFARLPAELVNLYGPTETAIDATSWRPPRDGVRGPLVPIGRPLANLRLRLLDGALRPLPPGALGRLHVGGPSLARGYLGRPDLTAERWLPDPFASQGGERLYDTGDLARFRPDGVLEFAGRADDQVKLRGFRIELGEIEAALEEHPQVVQAAAAVRDLAAGGGQELFAWVVPGSVPPAAAELAAFLRRKLPEHMVPATILTLSELPRTASGKLDRKALPEPVRAGGAGAAGAAGANGAPLLPLEQLVATLWEDLLGVERVGGEHDFFELGGHSLLAMQMASRLRETCGVEIPIAALFAHSTVAALAGVLAAELGAGRRSPLPPLVPAPRDRALPLSFAQQRLWFMELLEPGTTAYHILLFLRFEGDLDRSALAYGLEQLVRRHESLRTRFAMVAGEPVQVIAAPAPLSLPVIDLGALPPARRDAELARLADDEAARPFDLEHGPLLRLRLLATAASQHALFFALHHIAGDGWSMGLLAQELVAIYRARLNRQPMPLPELPLQYADFALWQRQWLAGAALEAEIEHWRRQLGGNPQAAELPADRPRPAGRFHRGATRAWSVGPALAAELTALGRRRGVTPFMLLLAALDLLLAYYMDSDDIVIGTDAANRDHLGSERLVGFFVNQLVLRTDLAGNPSFLELLRRVRRVTLDAYTHQHVPFERLVERLQPDRATHRPPFFQVKLVLQHDQGLHLELPGLTVRGLGREARGTAELDFILNLTAGPRGIAGTAYYSAELFERTTIDRILDQLHLVLESVAANPALCRDKLCERLQEDDDRRLALQRAAALPQDLALMRGARRRALAIPLAAADGESA
jgi:amino acid adenylation domain-containing protein/non-ribosomal peptide synthase protein (TIGR01720 family)